MRNTDNLRDRYWSLIIWASSAFGFIFLIVQNAYGLRGTDQYWYATDLLMLREGHGMASNAVYPTVWINDTSSISFENLPPPIHNVPVIYLATPINWVLRNEYLTWVVLNSILAALSAILLYALARRVTGPIPSSFIGAMFLISPQTVWFTLNPLMEQSLVLASILTVFFCVNLRNYPILSTLFLVISSVFLLSSRLSFILIIPPIAAFIFFALKNERRRRLALFLYLGLSTAAFALVQRVFDTYPMQGLRSVLRSGTPAERSDVAGMSNFYPNETWPDVSMVFGKFLQNLTNVVIPRTSQELIFETLPVLLLLIGTFLTFRIPKFRCYLWWAWTFAGIYFITAMVFQPQSRYGAAIFPLGILLTGLGLHESLAGTKNGRKLYAVASASAIIGLFTLSADIAGRYETSARLEGAAVQQIRSTLNAAPSHSTLVLNVQQIAHMKLSYALAPSPVVFANIRDDRDCIPRELLFTWSVSQVLTPEDWTQADLSAVFCDSETARMFEATDSVISTLESNLGEDKQPLKLWIKVGTVD